MLITQFFVLFCVSPRKCFLALMFKNLNSCCSTSIHLLSERPVLVPRPDEPTAVAEGGDCIAVTSQHHRVPRLRWFINTDHCHHLKSRCTLFRDVSSTETDAGRNKIKYVLPSGNIFNWNFKAGKNTLMK